MGEKDIIQAFTLLLESSINKDLTSTISKTENQLVNLNSLDIKAYLSENDLDKCILQSASLVKSKLGQINVIIHALGIVNLLEYILFDDEVIEELSLGAGNTNRPFDLVTNKRIAEFKFINWSGKQDTIRQNSVFKDYFELAEFDTHKKKYLYVLDKAIVLKFLNSKRNLNSVLSKNQTTKDKFFGIYGNKYSTVYDYFKDNYTKVEIVDLRSFDQDLFKCIDN